MPASEASCEKICRDAATDSPIGDGVRFAQPRITRYEPPTTSRELSKMKITKVETIVIGMPMIVGGAVVGNLRVA
jgi:hypothetical protein